MEKGYACQCIYYNNMPFTCYIQKYKYIPLHTPSYGGTRYKPWKQSLGTIIVLLLEVASLGMTQTQKT